LYEFDLNSSILKSLLHQAANFENSLLTRTNGQMNRVWILSNVL